MKIELYYDPVRPETIVFIDGKKVDRTDIFGFLYPVRGCLLQTWLPESRAWSGLRQQISELSRGEHIDFVFYGRAVDYDDLEKEMRGMADVTITFSEMDVESAYELYLNEISRNIKDRISLKINMGDTSGVDVSRSARDLFTEQTALAQSCLEQNTAQSWVETVSTQQEFDAVIQNNTCCVVEQSFLSTFEAFNSLEYLTGSMQRAADMICCVFTLEEKKKEFEYYAAQFPSLKPRFVASFMGECEKQMEKKYGEPFMLRKRLKGLEGAYRNLLSCYEDRPALEQKKSELLELKDRIGKDDARELNQCSWKLRWLANQERKMKELGELLGRDITEIMMGTGR